MNALPTTQNLEHLRARIRAHVAEVGFPTRGARHPDGVDNWLKNYFLGMASS